VQRGEIDARFDGQHDLSEIIEDVASYITSPDATLFDRNAFLVDKRGLPRMLNC